MSYHVVTGGAGFLGAALVRRLHEAGHRVRVLDRMSRGSERRLPKGMVANLVDRADVRDTYAVWRAIWGADTVWHLAYVQGTQNFYQHPREVIDVALRGIVNVLDACAHSGKRPDLFLISSSEAYQIPPPGMFPTGEDVPLSVPDVTNPRYSYGGGKIAAEVATMAHRDVLNRAVIVRPHNIYGPDMGEEHVIPQVARRVQRLVGGELPIQGDGTATRCFCYIDDAVDGLLALHERGETGVYHLGDPREEVAVADLALRIARFYGKNVRLAPSQLPKGSPLRRVPDISKMRTLGFEPKVSLDDGLARTLEWYSESRL